MKVEWYWMFYSIIETPTRDCIDSRFVNEELGSWRGEKSRSFNTSLCNLYKDERLTDITEGKGKVDISTTEEKKKI